MVDAYGVVYQRLRDRLDDVLAMIKDHIGENGPPPPKAWIKRQERYQELLRQTKAELQAFTQYAGGQVGASQLAAVQLGQQDAQALMAAALPPQATVTFNPLPADAVQNIVGFLGDGSPLKELLDRIPFQVGKRIERELLAGVAMGLNARQVGRQIRKAAGLGLTRSLTIARTETLRAYRHASIQSYRENTEVVEQWEWLASRSVRTCAMCLAMDGKRFPLSTPFGSHPNCRCTAIPVLKSWEELGFSGIEEEEKPETGAEWFVKQPEEAQRTILGDAKYEAWKAGKITLQDLIGYENDRRWGPSRWERSLKDVMAG